MNAVVVYRAKGPRDAVFFERRELFEELFRFVAGAVAGSGASRAAIVACGEAAPMICGLADAVWPILAADSLEADPVRDPGAYAREIRRALGGDFASGPLLAVSPLSGVVSPGRLAVFLEAAGGRPCVSAASAPANANPFWTTLLSAKSRTGRWFRGQNLTEAPQYRVREVWEARCGGRIPGSQWLPAVHRADGAFVLDVPASGEAFRAAAVARPEGERPPLLYALPVFEISPDEPLSFKQGGPGGPGGPEGPGELGDDDKAGAAVPGGGEPCA